MEPRLKSAIDRSKLTPEQQRQMDICEQVIKELSGDLAELIMCVNPTRMIAVLAHGDIVGGFSFDYARKLTSNKSERAHILALKNGKRRIHWYRDGKQIEVSDEFEPERMEEVWWNHTACAVRIPPIVRLIAKAGEYKFELGRIVYTHGVADSFMRNETITMLHRHRKGDWGDLCEEDKATNDQALREGSRLLSKYKFPDGRSAWVITEWDRSATTVLLPDEY